MGELLSALGVDWKLLLAQGVNFFIVLAVLTVVVYRPLLAIIAERKTRIAKGLRDAEEAGVRLGSIAEKEAERLAVADKEAFRIIAKAEKGAETRVEEIIKSAEVKAARTIEDADAVNERRAEEARAALEVEAKQLLKKAVTRYVGLAADAVDEQMVAEAAGVFGTSLKGNTRKS